MAKLKKAFKWLGSNFDWTTSLSFWVFITLSYLPENLDSKKSYLPDGFWYFYTIFICLLFAAVFVYEIVVYRKKQKVRKMD
jgi:hypothetical protein